MDNQPAVHIAQNPVCHSRIKHIQLGYHYIREAVQNKPVTLRYVNTKEQLADIATKILPRVTFERIVAGILTTTKNLA